MSDVHESLISKIEKELESLTVNIDKLTLFLDTSIFTDLQGIEKTLLKDQLNAMCMYEQALHERLKYYKAL